MRYSAEPKYRKYFKRYGFFSFARKICDKYGKKLMNTATKTGIYAAKPTSKRVVQKTLEPTGDLIGNKIDDKITSVGKTKSKETEIERQEVYISPEKRTNYWWLKIVLTPYKNGLPKNYLVDTTPDNLPTKKWVGVHDKSGRAEDRYKPSNQIRFKTSMLRSDFCNFSDAYIVVKGDIILTKGTDKDFIDTRKIPLAFKSSAPFTYCISKINNVLIVNAEDLDVIMTMYNLLKYSKN